MANSDSVKLASSLLVPDHYSNGKIDTLFEALRYYDIGSIYLSAGDFEKSNLYFDSTLRFSEFRLKSALKDLKILKSWTQKFRPFLLATGNQLFSKKLEIEFFFLKYLRSKVFLRTKSMEHAQTEIEDCLNLLREFKHSPTHQHFKNLVDILLVINEGEGLQNRASISFANYEARVKDVELLLLKEIVKEPLNKSQLSANEETKLFSIILVRKIADEHWLVIILAFFLLTSTLSVMWNLIFSEMDKGFTQKRYQKTLRDLNRENLEKISIEQKT